MAFGIDDVLGWGVGALAGSLFGGGGGGGVVTQQATPYSKEQRDLLAMMAATARDRVLKGADYRDPENIPEVRQVGNFWRNYSTWAPGQVESIFGGDVPKSPYTGKYVQQQYKDVVMPTFEQEYLPKIRSEFAGPGYWGSARARAVSDAFENLQRQQTSDYLTAEKGRVLQDYQTELANEDARRQALLSIVGTMPSINQQLFDFAARTIPYASEFMNPYWKIGMSLLGYQPVETIAGVQQPQPTFWDTLSQAAGRQFASALPGMASNVGSWISNAFSPGGGQAYGSLYNMPDVMDMFYGY